MTEQKEKAGLGVPSQIHRSPFVWLVRNLPTLLVLAGLAGIGAWGHRTGWAMPRFSSISVNQETKPDWCDAHGVPESQCVECREGLLPREKDFGWCKRHGVPNCLWEHPELAQVESIPRIERKDIERAERALAFAGRPENNSKCKLQARRIQFSSQDAVEKAGIEVETVWRQRIVESIMVNGEIGYDQTRVARLSSRLPGSIWKVAKQVGEPVRSGEVIALVDAADVGKAKSEFLQALVQFDLRSKAQDSVHRSAYVAAKDVMEVEAGLREAQIRLATAEQALLNLGFLVRAEEVKKLQIEDLTNRLRLLEVPRSLVAELDPRTTTANLLPVKSPLDGIVVDRQVVAGEVVDPSKLLLVVADPKRMWLTLNVRLEEAVKIKLGQQVRFRPSGGEEESACRIDWVSTEADEKTRTLRVRASLPNADGHLRANTFGTGQIVLREEEEAITVPNEALHWEGCCYVVFVRDRNYLKADAPKVFHVRKVQLGAHGAETTEIAAGVLPGELVASKGSGALRAELLKNDLGEG